MQKFAVIAEDPSLVPVSTQVGSQLPRTPSYSGSDTFSWPQKMPAHICTRPYELDT